jgi:tryptophan 7-halogenase
VKVCIIGGGTAGWWTAAYLRKNHPQLYITLVESSNIPSIGVGESTMPHVRAFFEDLGIDESSWLKSCSGVRKTGNLKQGWLNKNDEPLNFKFWYEGFDQWLPKYLNGEVTKDSLNSLYDNDGWQSYAYHVDAAQAWQIVKDHVKDINHVIQEITPETLPEADLYVDCTGLHRALVKDRPMHTYKDTLVNTCIVRRIKETPKNNSESFARDYGWEFNVYLSDERVGCGYVFCDSMITLEQAKEEYMRHNSHREFLSDFRVIKWQPGRLKTAWEGNTVAIGLSSGFVDPLEANGLSILVWQIRALSKFLHNPKAFNRVVNKVWDDVAEFIWHHYALTERDDTEFWKHYKHIDAIESLRDNIKKKKSFNNIYVSSVYETLAVYFNATDKVYEVV